MQRLRLIPLVGVVALALVACGAQSSAPPTLTMIVTETMPAPQETSSVGGSITVVNPTTGESTTPDEPSTSDTASTAPSSTNETGPDATSTGESAASTTSTQPTRKGRPLAVTCGTLLNANAIEKALGKSIPPQYLRIEDIPNPDVKMTGRIKCYYGADTLEEPRPVTVVVAQYETGEAATAQMNRTVQSETASGAIVSTEQVSDVEAHVLLRDGGMLIMQHNDWTLVVAFDDKLIDEKKMPAALSQLATAAFARVSKVG